MSIPKNIICEEIQYYNTRSKYIHARNRVQLCTNVAQIVNAKKSHVDTLIYTKRSYLFITHSTIRLICI